MAAPQSINDVLALVSTSEILIQIIAIAGLFLSVYVTAHAVKFVLIAIRGEDNWNAPTDRQLQNWFDSLDPESREWNGIKTPQDLRDLW